MPVPPVLLIIFRRPDTTRQVFEAIRNVRPAQLFLAADGPRLHRRGEAEACAETRSVVAGVDWPCEVRTWFRDENVGAGRNVSEAVTWFLGQCGEGCILEDDCLPHPDFFRFVSEGLERYRDDERVMHISGSSFRGNRRFTEDSYVFSRYNHGWGWATWKRAWDKLDLEMVSLDRFLFTAIQTGFWDSSRERRYWTKVFRQARNHEMDAWDFQWKLTLWKEGGFCLYPEPNLVSNLGFGGDATNTVNDGRRKANRPFSPLGTIRHPEFMVRHRVADQDNFRKMYWGSGRERFLQRWRKLRSLFGAKK